MNTTTVTVPGTFHAVTFDADSYAGQTVYVHRLGEGYWTGERIGVLGAMVGHGQFATFGKPDTYGGNVRRENVINWWVERITREEAAIRMATQWLNDERVGHVGPAAA